MRREEAETANVRGDVVEDCFGNGDAVVGGRAAAKLVEDDERARCCFREDFLRFGELDEEG